MRPRRRRPHPAVCAVLRRQREEARSREAARARAELERAAREVEGARTAVLRLRLRAAYADLVDRGLAFDTAGGRPPPPGWRDG